jgi:hypothetical protein
VRKTVAPLRRPAHLSRTLRRSHFWHPICRDNGHAEVSISACQASAEPTMNKTRWKLVFTLLLVAFFGVSEAMQAQFRPRDPGVRPAGAGDGIAGLTADEAEMFQVGLEDFSGWRIFDAPRLQPGEKLVGKPE